MIGQSFNIMPRTMKLISKIFMLCAAVTVCSCGEMFNFETEQPRPDGLYLSHHEIDLLVGDTITFGTELTPDTVQVSYYWLVKGDEEAVELAGRKLHAMKPGRALVVVQAQTLNVDDSESVVSDSCYVNVFGWQECDPREFLYETVLYSSLVVDGVQMTDSLGRTRLVAVVDGEVRADAEMRQKNGIPYLQMRIKGSWPGEEASIECYVPEMYERFVLGTLILDGETHGTLSDLKRYRAVSRNYGK